MVDQFQTSYEFAVGTEFQFRVSPVCVRFDLDSQAGAQNPPPVVVEIVHSVNAPVRLGFFGSRMRPATEPLMPTG